MRVFLMVFLFFMSSCGEHPKLHLADLKSVQISTSEITLLQDDMNSELNSDTESADTIHNVVPPHGSVLKGQVIGLLNRKGPCFESGVYSFCEDNDLLGTRLNLSSVAGNSVVKNHPIGGSFNDILNRFFGSGQASLYEVIQFDQHIFGLHHKYGFTVFSNGKFCQSVRTNPNGNTSFGVDSRKIPLIFTTGSWTDVDIPVEGWHEYDIQRLCN